MRVPSGGCERAHPTIVLAVLSALGACREPTATGPGIHGAPIGGNYQVGEPGRPLPLPLEVVVRDESARAVAGIPVRWRVLRNGIIDGSEPLTDAAGRARAWFRLGDQLGAALATATIADREVVTFSLEAREPEPPREVPLGELVPLSIPTYDGSGEVVHPDHATTPLGSSLRRLAITPYPNGNAAYENPSLFTGRVGDDWAPPPGLENPIVRPPRNAYLSDPDLVVVPETGELWLYYRQVTGQNAIYLTRSADGIRWGAPELVATAPSHEIISPAVVRRAADDWWMWSINGGAIGCSGTAGYLELRRSTDGRRWGPPRRLTLAHGSLTPWHIEVQWLPTRHEFWAVYNVKQPGNCATPGLFLATSPDGESWTPIEEPVLVKGRIPAFHDVVYRSTFEYRPATDDVLLWYSGARFHSGRWIWSAAVERRPRTELFGSTKSAARDILSLPPPAPLEQWP
jgi:hypothetical protein